MKTQKLSYIMATLLLLVMGNACSPVSFENEQSSLCNDSNCTSGDPTEPDGDDFDGKTLNFKAPTNKPKTDILFVIDNSRSMSVELQTLGDRFSRFTETLSALDWQICVTTTDAETLKGELLTISGTGGKKVSTAQTAQFDQAFKATLNTIPFNQDDAEQGIKATNLALRNAFKPAAADCFRSDASLAVVIVSDEDELNDGWARGIGTGLDPRADNFPASVKTTVATVFGKDKAFTFNGFSILPNDSTCRTDQRRQVGIIGADGKPVEDSTWGHYGLRIGELATLTGGVMRSVCSTNYGNQLSEIATGIESTTQSIALDCENADIVEVRVNPTVVGRVWDVKKNLLTFSPGLSGGDEVFVRYRCQAAGGN